MPESIFLPPRGVSFQKKQFFRGKKTVFLTQKNYFFQIKTPRGGEDMAEGKNKT
ncbi:MAG: hypothetical protein J6P44_00055 [Bacteroidales bacterium]|nr:hypothetical protein [Bacteroidales bacterium]